MSTAIVWSVPKRLAFRFGFVLGVLYVFPFPLGFVPKTEDVGKWLGKPLEALVLWFAQAVLGLPRPPTEFTGSGDTTFAYVSFLVIVILAVIGAAVWSVLDRRRTAYPRLATGAVVALRYLLGFTLLSYGFAKIVPSQFPPPSYMALDARFGDMSPMSVLWKFMGHSTPYTVFSGLAEALAGVLLLWRRTAVLGALVAIAVMTNVVMLNFCYDVPVKLYSSQLLLIAGLIAAPQLRRLIAAVFGHATEAVPPRPRSSARNERLRLAAKVAALAVIAYSIHHEVDRSSQYRTRPAPLDGIWVVDTWTAGGVEHPPLTTDVRRWRKLILQGGRGQVRSMTDERTRLSATVEPMQRAITVKAGEVTEIWRYQQPDPTHLVIDGTWQGLTLHVTLTREPEPLQRTRGFHWIQEAPFNR